MRLTESLAALALLIGLTSSAPAASTASASRPPSPAPALHLLIAPQTLRSDEVTLLWDRPEGAPADIAYQVICDAKVVAVTPKTHYTARGLRPEHRYRFVVRPATASEGSGEVSFETAAREREISVEQFGAKGDGRTLDTRAIQAAIDACPPHGVVRIPRGVFVSGALFLKSDMTLSIAEGGVLQGSTNPADYEPFIRNRFEGWEMSTYASLLNAGRLDHAGPANVRHLSIRGAGTIRGGGDALGKAMIAAHGLRSRGRLICLMNCADVEIQGLRIEDPPCWTIHPLYCENVTCHDLTITSDVRNGDGLDPDSSKDVYIVACSFSTGDDCIAIKSGKNPEGNVINRPTENVRITDCRFMRGHGISVGSEISGGVRGVLVEDCVAGDLLNGLQIKATKERGAYVEDVVVRDCDLQKITVLTALGYNNDGAPAPEQPYFRNFRFARIDLTKANPKQPVIVLHGFPAEGHETKDVTFEAIRLPAGAVVEVDRAADVRFENVTTSDGHKPQYHVTRSSNVTE